MTTQRIQMQRIATPRIQEDLKKLVKGEIVKVKGRENPMIYQGQLYLENMMFMGRSSRDSIDYLTVFIHDVDIINGELSFNHEEIDNIPRFGTKQVHNFLYFSGDKALKEAGL